MNDHFGIQTRGGCSCAGTYGHFLLHVDQHTSKNIEEQIIDGCLIERPGWIRMSIHPTHTNKEIQYLMDGLKELAKNYEEWCKDYDIDYVNSTMIHKSDDSDNNIKSKIDDCFEKPFC